MPIYWLDIETRSQCDLIKHGLARYAQDPTTQIICMSYARDDAPPQTWFAEDGEPFPAELIEHFAAGGLVYAHNASFERALFDYVVSNDFDFTPPRLEQWRCSAARALAHGLPASLANLCKALALPVQKMSEGSRLIRDYSAPGFLTEWKAGDRELMQQYCETDVATMRAACSVLRELDDYEWAQYHTTERINDRGVPLDVPFVESAVKYGSEVREDANAQIQEVTGYVVEKASERKARDQWLTQNLSYDLLKLITKNEKIVFDKHHRALLAAEPELPPHVAKFIQHVEEAGGATISKYTTMCKTHVDGRVHGALTWSGAGATGRYSSKGLQLQNMRRDVYKDPAPYIHAVLSNVQVEKPAEMLGRLIRASITSPSKLTYSDYSQIEARVLPWLSDSTGGREVLDVFTSGRDLYTENAKRMFHSGNAAEYRQHAKVAVLACGFGGGWRALLSMAKLYGMHLTSDHAKQIVTKWRDANEWAVNFWDDLKDAALAAYHTPNVPMPAGRLTFMYDGADWLWMQLPSGRCLAYHQPRIEYIEMPWGDEDYALTCLWGASKPRVGKKWPRRALNHLILAENATQAAAADIMRETIVRAEQQGLNPLFSVHDELVCEGECADALHACMLDKPVWADGLPLDAETTVSERYGK